MKPTAKQCTSRGMAIGMSIGVGMGLLMDNIAIGVALGPAFGVAVGKSLQKRYGYEAQTWANMSDKNKRIKLILIGILSVALLVGIIVYYLI